MFISSSIQFRFYSILMHSNFQVIRARVKRHSNFQVIRAKDALHSNFQVIRARVKNLRWKMEEATEFFNTDFSEDIRK